MTCSLGEQRVSIAGTVTNRVSGEIIPGAQVRLTKAPMEFTANLIALIQQAIQANSCLKERYLHLFHHRPITSDTLKTAQMVLDALGRSQQFTGQRPDETVTGGDGHYCFLNLPVGEYGVTAAISMLDRRYGMSSRSVLVKPAINALVFSQLDIEIFLGELQTSFSIYPAEPDAVGLKARIDLIHGAEESTVVSALGRP